MFRKISVFTLCLVFLFAFSFFAYAETGARITHLKGEVKIQKQAAGAWSDALTDMKVSDGDKIKTSPSSEAEIAIDEDMDNVIKIDENSELTIDSISGNRTQLHRGKMFAMLDGLSQGSSFEVRTPTAVCGVMGSGISVDTGNNRTSAGCHEDEAYARGINKDGSLTGKKIIKEGFKSLIEKFKPPQDLVRLSGLEKRQWRGFKKGLRERRPGTSNTSGNQPKKIIQRIEKMHDLSEKKEETRIDDRIEERDLDKVEKTEPCPGAGGSRVKP